MSAEARAEAERRHPSWHYVRGPGIVQSSHWKAGFVKGAEWQASREVTDAVAMRAAQAVYERNPIGGTPWEALDRGVRVEYEKDARAALVAAREVRS